MVAVPAAFAVLTLLTGRRREALGVGIAVAGAVTTLAWSVWAATLSSRTLDGTAVDHAWVAALDIRWHLGLDGISAPLVLMTTLVFCCALVSLLRSPPDCGGSAVLAALLLIIESGVLGSFLALDMVVFFAFFEVALIPMWFVIDAWGDAHGPDAEGRRRKAATRFLVFTVLGSALMLVGFVMVRSEAGTFDIVRIASTYDPTGPTALAAAVLVGLGLAVKTPLWPLHIWLPDAHSTAPTVGSVVLAAVLLKLGTYGFIRFWMPVTDPDWEVLVPFVAGLAVVGIVYAALACLAQTDLKRLIAYSSVGHMGFVVLAVTTYTVGGVQAAVFVSVAHGLITGLLFFVAGSVKDRYHTGDLAELRGLYGRVPRLGAVFAFAAMASLGLPGLAGFWGEMLAIRSAIYPAGVLPRNTFAVLAVIAAFGVILTSAYFLSLMRSMLQGKTSGPSVSVSDVRGMEWVVWSPLVLLTLVLGVAPGLLLGPVGEAAAAFLGSS
ncbi:MAG: NADH-quinone oxidoreductase subunit M [Nocardioidaceae bacterium]|nr:NADH-quinone oxidoreductase subunit M [Nocardioidaceae bacterium]